MHAPGATVVQLAQDPASTRCRTDCARSQFRRQAQSDHAPSNTSSVAGAISSQRRPTSICHYCGIVAAAASPGGETRLAPSRSVASAPSTRYLPPAMLERVSPQILLQQYCTARLLCHLAEDTWRHCPLPPLASSRGCAVVRAAQKCGKAGLLDGLAEGWAQSFVSNKQPQIDACA